MKKLFRDRKILVLTLIIILIVSVGTFQNCAPKSFEVKEEPPKISPIGVTASIEKLKIALFSASKTFVGRLPSEEELAQGVTLEGYRAVINKYLADPQFVARMAIEHQNYFGFSGGSGIDNGSPSRLGAFLIENDLDYRDILRTEICVDGTPGVALTTKPYCSDTFPDLATAQNHAGGVLTSRAFIATNKSVKAFNFRIVKVAYQKFNCRGYPDSSEAGLTLNEISNTLHPFSKKEDGTTSDCFSCHRTINAKASVFYDYGMDGVFNATKTNTTFTDTERPSTFADLMAPGVKARVDGQELLTAKDWGKLMANSPNFAKCMANRYLNFMLGKPTDSPALAGMEYLAEQFRDSGFKVRDLLRAIVTSSPYIHRNLEPPMQSLQLSSEVHK